MAKSIFLISTEEMSAERFFDLVVSIGGVRLHDESADARLSDGYAHVWVHMQGLPVTEPAELSAYEAALGGRVKGQVELLISRSEGSEALAWRIIDAASRQWHIVVDNGADELDRSILSVSELRARAEVGPSGLFRPHEA